MQCTVCGGNDIKTLKINIVHPNGAKKRKCLICHHIFITKDNNSGRIINETDIKGISIGLDNINS